MVKNILSNRKRGFKSKKNLSIFLVLFLCMAVLGFGKDQTETKQVVTKKTETKKEEIRKTVLQKESSLEVHFINVDQADATLFICDGEAMLLDAGNNSDGTKIQLYLNKQGVKSLKYLILTHPDSDHIGGADVIITKFPIENVFMSDYEKDTRTYEDVIDALEYKRLKWSTPKVGSTYSLGNAKFTILAPNKKYQDPNEASISLILEHGENSFLFTGDAEYEAEKDIIGTKMNIDCDVLKAGHHGSKTSNSKEFLKKASPEFVVVSCGEENSYGHPHAEPMNQFRSMGTKLFRTDEQGTIVASSDGKELSWNMSPTESWTPGEAKGSSTEASKKSSVNEKKSVTTKKEEEKKQQPAVIAAEAPPVPPAQAAAAEPQPTATETQPAQPQRAAVIETPPAQAAVSEAVTTPQSQGSFAVNNKNGKIHMVGECSATKEGHKSQMTDPIYFNTYEEAETYSKQAHPGQDKIKCGNCW